MSGRDVLGAGTVGVVLEKGAATSVEDILPT